MTSLESTPPTYPTPPQHTIIPTLTLLIEPSNPYAYTILNSTLCLCEASGKKSGEADAMPSFNP